MVKNFKHSPNLKTVFDNLDRLGVPYKATLLENSVLTEIDDQGNEGKVACLIDNLEVLND